MYVNTVTKTYEKTWFIVVMLFVFAPVGLFLMWKYKRPKSKTSKVILSIVCSLIFAFEMSLIIPINGYNSINGDYDKYTAVTKEVHGLKYQIPNSWENLSARKAASKHHERRGIMGKYSFARMEVTYLGDEVDLTDKPTVEKLCKYFAAGDSYEVKRDIFENVDIEKTIEIQHGKHYIEKCSFFTVDRSSFKVSFIKSKYIRGKDELTKLRENMSLKGYKSPAPVKLDSEYNGKTKAGTWIHNRNRGFRVIATYKDGEYEEVNGWKIVKGKGKLAPESLRKVTLEYEGVETNLDIKSTTKVEKIKVIYDGDRKAGVVIDKKNPGLKVEIIYNDNSYYKAKWSVKSVTLETDETSDVIVKSYGHKKKIKVKCSTLSKGNYKKQSKAYAFTELKNAPENFKNKRILVKGTVVKEQPEVEGSGYIVKFNSGIDEYACIYDKELAEKPEKKISKGSTIYAYGRGGNLSFYDGEDVFSTIPAIYAKYIEVLN